MYVDLYLFFSSFFFFCDCSCCWERLGQIQLSGYFSRGVFRALWNKALYLRCLAGFWICLCYVPTMQTFHIHYNWTLNCQEYLAYLWSFFFVTLQYKLIVNRGNVVLIFNLFVKKLVGHGVLFYFRWIIKLIHELPNIIENGLE